MTLTKNQRDALYGKSKGKVFVWVKGIRGPEPQIWEKDVVEVFKDKFVVLASKELPEDQRSWELAQLVELYPADPSWGAVDA